MGDNPLLCDIKYQSENIPGMHLYEPVGCSECEGYDVNCRDYKSEYVKMDEKLIESDLRELETLSMWDSEDCVI